MKTKFFFLFSFFLMFNFFNAQDHPNRRWSLEKSKAWGNEQPWFCGFNYIPAYAINYTAMWDKTSFDPKKIDKELELAEGIGMNCLRAVLQYAVYKDDPKYFLKTLDTFLEVCDKHHIKFMPAFFDDCVFGIETEPTVGKQPEPLEGWYAWAWSPSPGHREVVFQKEYPQLKNYVQDVLKRFENDPRIFAWDLYNEPTNGGLGNASLPLLRNVFKWAREINPDQPLTVAIWNNNEKLNKIILNNVDVVSFHNYGDKRALKKQIKGLQKYKRPLINTEWLNRNTGSTIQDNLPVFYNKNVGCMLWGLVNGKTQTDLPWGHRPGDPLPKFWQHDLFHGDLTPYSKAEIAFLKKYIKKSNENK